MPLVRMVGFWFFFFSSRRRHTRCGRDWSSTCALPILKFGKENGGNGAESWIGQTYLEASKHIKHIDRKYGKTIAENIKKIIRGEGTAYSLEYPCDTPSDRKSVV